MATTEELLILIKADTDQLKTEMAKAKTAVKGLGKEAETGANAMASSFRAVTGIVARFAGPLALGLAAKKAADFTIEALRAADAIGDLSTGLGLTAEQYQSMSFAAGLSGVETGKFTSAIAKMNDMVGRALGGDTAAVEYFQDIGIAIEELEGKDPETIFKRISQTINEMSSTQKQAAASAELFGVKNLGMLTIMREGPAAFEANQKAAHELGAVMSNELVAAAGETIDKFEAMKTSLGTNAKVIFITLFKPAVELATKVMHSLNASMAEFARRIADVKSLSTTDLALEIANAEKDMDAARKRWDGARDKGSPQAIRDLQTVVDLEERLDAMYARRTSEGDRRGSAKLAPKAPSESELKRLEEWGKQAKTAVDKIDEQMARLEGDKAKLDPAVYEANHIRLLKERQAALEQLNAADVKASAERAKSSEQAAEDLQKQIEAEQELAEFRAEAIADREKETQDLIEKEEQYATEMAQRYLESVDPAAAFEEQLRKELAAYQELGYTVEELAALEKTRRDDYASQNASLTETMLQNWSDVNAQMDVATSAWLSNSADLLTDFVTEGKADFHDFAKSIIKDITAMIIKMLIFRAVGGAMSGMFGGGASAALGGTEAAGNAFNSTAAWNSFGSNVASPFTKASGGHVNPSSTYMVGERGPELFTPPAVGKIHPTGSFGGGGGSVKVEIVNKGTPQQAVSQSTQFDPRGMVVQVITEDMRRGGPISAGMSQLYGLRRQS